jgi:4-hydroxy 2-oxovalerate aldolase
VCRTSSPPPRSPRSAGGWTRLASGLLKRRTAWGLGASSIQYGFAAATDPEYVAAAVDAVSGADIAVLYVPGVATLTELKAAQESGANTVRVAVHCTEADCAEQPVRWAREQGLRVMSFLMMSHKLTPQQLAEQAVRLESYGAQVIYVVDSAGALVPRGAAARVAALRDAVDAEIGFHAHNNLGVGIANALVAAEQGALWIDGSLRGLGASAGNAQTEVLAAAFERAGYHTGVDLFPLIDTAEHVVAPLMEFPQIVDETALILGYAGVYSTFFQPHQACSEEVRGPGTRHPHGTGPAGRHRRTGRHDHPRRGRAVRPIGDHRMSRTARQRMAVRGHACSELVRHYVYDVDDGLPGVARGSPSQA